MSKKHWLVVVVEYFITKKQTSRRQQIHLLNAWQPLFYHLLKNDLLQIAFRVQDSSTPTNITPTHKLKRIKHFSSTFQNPWLGIRLAKYYLVKIEDNFDSAIWSDIACCQACMLSPEQVCRSGDSKKRQKSLSSYLLQTYDLKYWINMIIITARHQVNSGSLRVSLMTGAL